MKTFFKIDDMGKNPQVVQLNIFGEKEVVKAKKSKADIFEDYDSFTEKFKPKKTTDDCYTPDDVYEGIRRWVNDNILPLDGLNVVRPFKPGGDYRKEAESYGANTFVLDNPPFSILAQIRKFYCERNIGFFLFAPTLTLLTAKTQYKETYIVAFASIIYENGADVNTSFVTNRYPRDVVMAVRGDLCKAVKAIIAGRPAKAIPRYEYPPQVVSPALMGRIARSGISLEFDRSETQYLSRIDAQIPLKKSIFGNGLLISERLAAERLAAERLAAERLAAERLAAERLAERELIIWELSEREKEIIAELGRNRKHIE